MCVEGVYNHDSHTPNFSYLHKSHDRRDSHMTEPYLGDECIKVWVCPQWSLGDQFLTTCRTLLVPGGEAAGSGRGRKCWVGKPGTVSIH